MVIGRHVPAAMIFVPSRGGVSHSPDEHSEPEQIELGVRELAETLRQCLRAGIG
jgi:allantoate deiminase